MDQSHLPLFKAKWINALLYFKENDNENNNEWYDAWIDATSEFIYWRRSISMTNKISNKILVSCEMDENGNVFSLFQIFDNRNSELGFYFEKRESR